MKRSVLLGVLAVAVAVCMPCQSQADQILDFSFTNTIGNVNGTVTGEIDLSFTGDGTGAASHVFVDSIPAGFPSIGTLPLDFLSPAVDPGVAFNTFTVSGGAVTSANFGVYTDDGYYPSVQLFLSPKYGYNYYLYDDVNGALVYASGASFTPASSATPEPAALTLLGTGLFAVGGFGLWRRRRATTAS
jgi:hypothetical protein